MPSSLFAATARTSRFWSFVSFLIGFPFVGLGRASRDDANDFLVVFLIGASHPKKNRTHSYGANRYPTFLIVKGGIALSNRVGIIENENGSFKANVIFTEVLPALVLIPLKSHS